MEAIALPVTTRLDSAVPRVLHACKNLKSDEHMPLSRPTLTSQNLETGPLWRGATDLED